MQRLGIAFVGLLRTLAAVLAVLVAVSAPAAEAATDRRVALVIGNGAYSSVPALPNPTNDAQDVAQLLRALGFDVTEATNLDRQAFGAAVGGFLQKAEGVDAALVYYAGHGLQYDEDNYLLPVDANLENAFSLKTEAFSLRDILGELEAVSKVNLVFLDACRDNPLAAKLSEALATRGVAPLSRGLARVDPTGANTLVAYAAGPGELALDGAGRNSPFTAAFLKNVQASNEEVSTLFKAIVRDVAAATEGRQRPQVVSTMEVNFYFHGDVTVNVPQLSEAQRAYEAAAAIGIIEAYQAVADGFPDTVQAKLALAAVEAARQEAAAEQQVMREPEDLERDLGLTASQRMEVQLALTNLGFDTGGSDGAFGPNTRRAIRQYQDASGFPETGYVSQELLAALSVPIAPAADGSSRSGDLARRISLASLPQGVDARLKRAVEAFARNELVYGAFGGSLYVGVLTNVQLTWEDARQRAERAGGHLVTIGSSGENDFIYSLLAAESRFFFSYDFGRYLCKEGPYIGLRQAEGAAEPRGGWSWVTGEPLDFVKWDPGQPNNYDGIEHYGNFAVCAEGSGDAADLPADFWADGRLRNSSSFVVEFPSAGSDQAGEVGP